MPFDFKLSLSVSSSPKSHKGELTMGQWANTFFDKLIEREGADHLKIQQQVLERQQILATAPELWQQVTDGIHQEVNDLNGMRPGLVVIKGEGASLSVSTVVRTLTLAFNKDIPKIIYSVSQSQGPNLQPLKVVDKKEFTFAIFGGEVWLNEIDGKIGVGGAVQNLLNYLIV
jgi:hypothetical protein